ncbi:hypothetical protein Goshw_008482 [Gossypium schwendimanii]|uniref:PGG domain-containing protein n=1 Tax=Gossypium schwendimanii TaxID=34291 RepID=A0A7J9N3U2_GOSSC|nr:hypothetical protein [Gossypium schwendimanii]
MELSLDSFWSLDVKANNSEVCTARIRLRNELSENMINATLVVTTLVITAIYQSCLSPPAGARQDEMITVSPSQTLIFPSLSTNTMNPFWV